MISKTFILLSLAAPVAIIEGVFLDVTFQVSLSVVIDLCFVCSAIVTVYSQR